MQRTTNEVWHLRELTCVPGAQCVGDRRERSERQKG